MITNSQIQPGDVIAVGDIHGRYDLLRRFLDHVQGSEAVVIFLGDIIDRGGEDLLVLETIERLLREPETEGLSGCFCLMGNHEDMMLEAKYGPPDAFTLWQRNGGNFEDYSEIFEHADWVEELPIYITIGDTLFIHGGVWPGVNPWEAVDSGDSHSLLWMREPFLSCGPQLESWTSEFKQVVFGHTPQSDQPYRIPQGVCIDTGAFHTGVLTSFNVTQDSFTQFTADGIRV